MKRLALLFLAGCLMGARAQAPEFTVGIEALGNGYVRINFITNDPVVGFVGEFEYQPVAGGNWVTSEFFAHHWLRTGGYLVMPCGACAGLYVTAQEVTGLGLNAVAFGGQNE